MVVVDDEGEHPLAGACCSAIALPSNAVGRNACRLSLIGQCQCRTNKMSYFIEKKKLWPGYWAIYHPFHTKGIVV